MRLTPKKPVTKALEWEDWREPSETRILYARSSLVVSTSRSIDERTGPSSIGANVLKRGITRTG
jgi:hypothetical protein